MRQFGVAEKDATKQKVLSFNSVSLIRKYGDQNRIYPYLTLQTAKLFPLKRVPAIFITVFKGLLTSSEDPVQKY